MEIKTPEINQDLKDRLAKAKEKAEENIRVNEREIGSYQATLKHAHAKDLLTQLSAKLAELQLKETNMRIQSDMATLEMIVDLFERTSHDIDVLKQAMQSLDVKNQSIIDKVNNIESVQEKREELFKYIDKSVERAKETEQYHRKWQEDNK